MAALDALLLFLALVVVGGGGAGSIGPPSPLPSGGLRSILIAPIGMFLTRGAIPAMFWLMSFTLPCLYLGTTGLYSSPHNKATLCLQHFHVKFRRKSTAFATILTQTDKSRSSGRVGRGSTQHRYGSRTKTYSKEQHTTRNVINPTYIKTIY